MSSLRARLLAIVGLSIVVLQSVSLLSLGAWRGWQSRQLANEVIVRDALGQRQRLLALPPQARPAALAGQSRTSYDWALVPVGLQLAPAVGIELRELGRAFVERGQGAWSPVRWQGHEAVRLPLGDGQDLLVWFAGPLPTTRPSIPSVLLYLTLISAVVGVVAWRAVAMVIDPLRRVDQAARRMTVDLEAAPMAEEGPLEVRSLAVSFNALQREVQRQLRARSGILAAVSHDLKSPLTRMKLRVAGMPEAELRHWLEKDLDAMSGMVEEGLAYARSERLREERVLVDLQALVENIVEQSMDLGLPCSLEGGSIEPLALAPRAVQRLVQNLVDNAHRYGGSAEIRLSSDASGVDLVVADRGPGVPVEDLERMFEPFVRGEASRGRSTGGSGLGLAIARNIALAHGGRLTLAPREGGGLEARLWLPRVSAAQAVT